MTEEKKNSKRMNIIMNIIKISFAIGFVFAFKWGMNGYLIDFVPSVIVLIVLLGIEIFDSYRKKQKEKEEGTKSDKITFRKIVVVISRKIVLYILAVIAFSSIVILCSFVFWPRSFETILINKDTYIDSSGVTITASKPFPRIKSLQYIGEYGKDSVEFLSRTQDIAFVEVDLATDDADKIDECISPNKIKLKDGNAMSYSVKVIDKDGEHYSPNVPRIYKTANGKTLAFHFHPQLSKKVKIIKLILEFEMGITCTKIVWYDN